MEQKVQLTAARDKSQARTPKRIRAIQAIIGTFLYYARAVDPTMGVALSTLASAQSKATEETAKAIVKFMNYCATHYTESMVNIHCKKPQ